jgi:hypothetical protein
MKRLAAGLAALMLMAVLGCTTATPTATATPATSSAASESADAELQHLESAKWDPASLGSRDAYMALFAEDFVSVEYGSDVQGGVHRKTRADVFSAPPLPPAKFALSEWKFIRADADVTIVSYRVNGLSFPWEAYATSVWVHRAGRWQTVFYQASTAK